MLDLPETTVKQSEDCNPSHTKLVLRYFTRVDAGKRGDRKGVEALEEEDKRNCAIDAGCVGARAEYWIKLACCGSNWELEDTLPLIIPPMM